MFALFTSLFGCGAVAGQQPASDKVPEIPMAPADPAFPITWQLSREGDALAIHYEIENRSEADVWLLDLPHVPTVAGYDPRPERITVLVDGPRVRLVRGHVRPPPGLGVAMEYTPVARRLAAGAKLTGDASVPLPIQPWHPYHPQQPAKKKLQEASLELGLLVGESPEGVPAWDQRFTKDTAGAAIQVPSLGFVVQRQKLVGAASKPLP